MLTVPTVFLIGVDTKTRAGRILPQFGVNFLLRDILVIMIDGSGSILRPKASLVAL